nr:hybrid sensor histidine kinase/response regulator [Geobacter sp. SVR]
MKPARILIVDDEPDIAQILKLHLEEAGYVTDWAMDGETCMAMLPEGQFSLVLLDIRMPGISGIQVLELIRSSGSDVAVMMMTAHGSESLAVECMRSGALDYVAKPFDLSDVLQRVERAIDFRRTLIEKQRLEREKDDFVSMLSHDLKNPITAVIGSIDIIREGRLGPVNSEQVEYLQSAIDSCNEVVGMIDNLLDIHRFEAGRTSMNIRPCSPQETILAASGRFAALAQQESVTLNVDLDQELPMIEVDRSAFSRIIANLVGNALKFTPPDGEITISCHALPTDGQQLPEVPRYAAAHLQTLTEHRHLVRLSVRDTGPGIPEEDQEHIFERFVQSRRNGQPQVGAGLGLAYCKLAVESFGGSIWVESSPGKGSEFIILFGALPDEESPDS